MVFGATATPLHSYMECCCETAAEKLNGNCEAAQSESVEKMHILNYTPNNNLFGREKPIEVKMKRRTKD